jgi:hypothetical protein
MKSALFSLIIAAIFLFAAPSNAANTPDDIRVVISEKKIWLVADEIPYVKLLVQIKNTNGVVVCEKVLSSKNADWSIDVSCLTKGRYTLYVGDEKTVVFDR